MDLDQTTPDDITAILAPVERAAETVDGWEDAIIIDLADCPECHGTGVLLLDRAYGPHDVQTEVACSDCGGAA